MSMNLLHRIVSGGQTGADRAALDVAIEAGIPYGGWCPKGGLAEDLDRSPGLLAAYPQLREADSPDPVQRTEWNVRDSDGTLVIVPGGEIRSRGTALTVRFAEELGRPFAVVDPLSDQGVEQAGRFLSSLPHGATLNVAGPRESQSPGVYEAARTLLGDLTGQTPRAR
jgi:hypothetical protein